MALACGSAPAHNHDGHDDDPPTDEQPTDEDVVAQCVDIDGDGFGVHCAAGTDCNDGDASVWQLIASYVDQDHDGYVGTRVDVCSGELLAPGYRHVGDDCDDTDDAVSPLAADLPDDGVDQDCDGQDFVASDENGFFVDGANGEDSNAGTKAAPVKTIRAAYLLANPEPLKRNVFVAAGAYDEEVDLEGVSLFGGYDAPAWTRNLTLETRLFATSVGIGSTVTATDAVLQGFTIDSSSDPGFGPLSVAGRTTVADCHLRNANATQFSSTLQIDYGSVVEVSRTRIEAVNAPDNFQVSNFGDVIIRDSVLAGCASNEICAGITNPLMARARIVRSSVATCGDSCTALYSRSRVVIEDSDLQGRLDAMGELVVYRSVLGDAVFGTETRVTIAASEIGQFSMSQSADVRVIGSTIGPARGAPAGALVNSGAGSLLIANDVLISENAPAIRTTGEAWLVNNTFRCGATCIDFSGSSTGPHFFAIINNDIFLDLPTGFVGSTIKRGSGDLSFVLRNNNLRLVDPDGNSTLALNTNDLDELNACQQLGCIDAGGNISSAPLTVSASDFHLTASSPNINAGTSPLPYMSDEDRNFALVDHDGNPRPVGERWDIGAFERQP